MKAVRTLSLLVAAFLAGLLTVAGTAQAAPVATCAAPVVDNTSSKVLDIPRVEKAVTDARRLTGLDIYVRAEQSAGIGPESWWNSAYRACPDWLYADGVHPKPNVLVVMFSMDRKSAIKYGDNGKKLDKHVDRIRERVLGAGLREANDLSDKQQVNGFTTAVEDTLVEITEQYNRVDTPFNWSKLFSWVGGILAAITSAVAGFFGIRRLREWKRDREEDKKRRAEAVERLRKEHDRATDAVLNVSLDEYLVRADSAIKGCDDGYALSDASEFDDRINALSGRLTELDTVVTKAMDTRDINDRADLFAEVSNGIEAVVDTARRRAEDVEQYARNCTLDAKLSAIDSARSGVSNSVSILESAPTWVDTKRAIADLDSARDELTAVEARAEHITRAELDDIISGVDERTRRARDVFDAAAVVASDLIAVYKSAEKKASKYARPVDDVSDKTRKKTHDHLSNIIHDISDYMQLLEESTVPVALAEARAAVSKFEQGVARSDTDALKEIADAKEERRKAREAREAAERAERERSYSNSSFNTGFSTGYIGGSFGGGFSGGGGAGFGGGSSGSW